MSSAVVTSGRSLILPEYGPVLGFT